MAPGRLRALPGAAGLASLLAGAWAGLARMGWPLPHAGLAPLHGPLMLCGFTGTVIALERAVGLGEGWAYAAPALAAAGAVALLAHAVAPATGLFVGAALLLVAAQVVIARRSPGLHTALTGLGAACWLAGNAQWARGAPLFAVVPWWIGFPLFTIAGERVELSRVLRPPRAARLLLAGLVVAWIAGLVVDEWTFVRGQVATGLATAGIAVWLFRHDLSRRVMHLPGLRRFMGMNILCSYGWLGTSGILLTLQGGPGMNEGYDAVLHMVFMGFMLPMVFAHAPVILPAVTGRLVPFRRAFYLHAGLMQAALLVRVAGDALGHPGVRRAGGLAAAVALVLFLANNILALTSAEARIKEVP